MPVGLSLHHNCRRQAFVAHSFREGFMIRTIIVDFVVELRLRNAVLTFLIRLMLSLAFGENL